MKTLYKLSLLALLIGLACSIKAQNRNYLPMLNEGAVWLETQTIDTYPPSPYGYHIARQISIDGDTLMNGHLYYKLYTTGVDVLCQENYDYNPVYQCAMREDAEMQKAWIVESGETEEILYFDFSLGIGDTVSENSYFCKEFWPVTVVDIDTITSFDGVNRRKWFFNSFEGSEVIEGIGSINGVLTPFFVYFEYWENLFCFTLDTIQIYPFPYQSNCILPSDTCLTVGVSEWGKTRSAGQSLMAYPNPATDFVFLKTRDKNPAIDTQLEIMDFTGKIVLRKRILVNHINGELIEVRHWPCGIYIATTISNGQVNERCKFVVN